MKKAICTFIVDDSVPDKERLSSLCHIIMYRLRSRCGSLSTGSSLWRFQLTTMKTLIV